LKLASFAPPYNVTVYDIEKFIMIGCKRGELSIRVDHETQTLTFDTNLFSAQKGSISEGPKLQALPSELMRTQIARLAKHLHKSINLIEPERVVAKQEAKTLAFKKILSGLEEEHKSALARKALIERKKEITETLIMRKEKEEARERALRAQQEAEAEKVRLAEESKRRELERIRREREEIERHQTQKLAEEMKKKNVKIEVEVRISVAHHIAFFRLSVDGILTKIVYRTLRVSIKTVFFNFKSSSLKPKNASFKVAFVFFLSVSITRNVRTAKKKSPYSSKTMKTRNVLISKPMTKRIRCLWKLLVSSTRWI
jgi:hypothetical protein